MRNKEWLLGFTHVLTRRRMDRSSHVDVPSVLWAGGTAFTSYLCRVSLASVSRPLMKSLSISERQYGLLSGAFYLPYMLFMMPSTFCVQRWGSTWMGVSVVVWGFISCLPVLAGGSFAWFFAIRMGLGVVQSGTFPSIMEYLRGFHSPTRMGTAYGIAASGVMVAEIASPLIVGCIDWVAGGRSGGMLGLAAWQWVFLVDGAATVVFGLLFLVAGAKTVSGTTTTTAAAKSPFQGGRSSSPAFDPWIGVIKDWRAWYLALVFLLVDQVVTGWIFFAPLIVSSFFGDGGDNDGDDLSTLSILLSAVPVGVGLERRAPRLDAHSTPTQRPLNAHSRYRALPCATVRFARSPVCRDDFGKLAGRVVVGSGGRASVARSGVVGERERGVVCALVRWRRV